MERITILKPGHRYSIRNIDGEGETILQFLQRQPLHEPMEGILLQDMLRCGIDRLRVLDHERPWCGNAESIKDLQMVIARQEARALIEAVRADKLSFIESIPTGANGHFDWERLDR